jgi:outer membrane murein-binding lipoprotein Lpp
MLIPLPYKILAVALIVGGAFAAGYNKGMAGADAKINQYANDVQELELALQKEQQMIREVVKVEYVDKITKIKEKEIRIVEAAAETVPGQYDLSNGWIHAHNAAASPSIELDMNLAADPASSFIKDNVALQTVVENYSICQQNAQQLASLQKYIDEVNKAIDKENEKRGINIKLPAMPWKKKEG